MQVAAEISEGKELRPCSPLIGLRAGRKINHNTDVTACGDGLSLSERAKLTSNNAINVATSARASLRTFGPPRLRDMLLPNSPVLRISGFPPWRSTYVRYEHCFVQCLRFIPPTGLPLLAGALQHREVAVRIGQTPNRTSARRA